MEDNKYVLEKKNYITLNMYYEWDGWDWIGWSLGGVLISKKNDRRNSGGELRQRETKRGKQREKREREREMREKESETKEKE